MTAGVSADGSAGFRPRKGHGPRRRRVGAHLGRSPDERKRRWFPAPFASGETRTRTGDTTIFRESSQALLHPETPANRLVSDHVTPVAMLSVAFDSAWIWDSAGASKSQSAKHRVSGMRPSSTPRSGRHVCIHSLCAERHNCLNVSLKAVVSICTYRARCPAGAAHSMNTAYDAAGCPLLNWGLGEAGATVSQSSRRPY